MVLTLLADPRARCEVMSFQLPATRIVVPALTTGPPSSLLRPEMATLKAVNIILAGSVVCFERSKAHLEVSLD